MKKSTILIIGADGQPPQKLKHWLFERNYNVVDASATSDIIELNQTNLPDLFIFYSTQYANRDALRIIKKFRQIRKRAPVILITKFSSESRAIAAIKAGVNDYLKFPLSYNDVIESVRRLLSNSNSPVKFQTDTGKNYTDNGHRMIGQNQHMKELKAYISKVAKADSTILINGETGKGISNSKDDETKKFDALYQVKKLSNYLSRHGVQMVDFKINIFCKSAAARQQAKG